ncbi:MAG: hypothetical protein QNJ45_00085 [Ardenticatenaceae bacterium]|nr:hypothetical protein [Ardenticatenaceae bacterium]
MLHKTKRRLSLLGPARVEKIDESHSEIADGNQPRFRSRRTIGLLGYLVAEQRPVARDYLAALFWPDEDPPKARANLSRELHNLAQILTDCWESDRQMVAFEPSEEIEVDLHQIVRYAEQERWSEAAAAAHHR